MMLNPATLITLSTLRLQCFNSFGSIAIGTGFLYWFNFDDDENHYEVNTIITNKHVVAEMDYMETTISYVDDQELLKDSRLDVGVEHHKKTFSDLQERVIPHPDPTVDLCAINITSFFKDQTKSLRHWVLNQYSHVDADTREILRPVERILMVGYPTGLWDETNNMPIVRTGLTASHALTRWNGKREFLVDCATFNGSSGSPVFLYEDGLRRSGGGFELTAATGVHLLGILWGAAYQNVEGEIAPIQIPTSNHDNSTFYRHMLSLGHVVHADALDDIKLELQRRVGAGEQLPG